MKDFWKSLKLGLYVFALPLVATAAASAHQWAANGTPLTTLDDSTVVKVSSLTPAAARITNQRNHTVALSSDGKVQGRVAAIDAATTSAIGLSGMKVFFVRDGKLAFQGYTNPDGTFVASGLSQGIYSFVASGENGFAAYGINVVHSDNADAGFIETFAVTPAFETVNEILSSRVHSEVADRVVSVGVSADEANIRHVAGATRVLLTDEGLVGHVTSLVSDEILDGTTASILKNDKRIAKAVVDRAGRFVVADLEAGIYDLVVSGPQGIAVVSFEASDAAPAEEPAEFRVSVSAKQDFAEELDVALTNQIDDPLVNQAFDRVYVEYIIRYEMVYQYPMEFAGERLGLGIAGGGGGGFGGGFFGGRGGLGLAGLITGVVALANDNDGDSGPASPADP